VITERFDAFGVLPEHDRARLQAMGFGQAVGFGERPALVLIDVQNYMVGPPAGSTHEYPSACETAPAALIEIQALVAAARRGAVPIIYTRFVLARDGKDAGVYMAKRGLPTTEGWCLEDSEGADIVSNVAPAPSDFVIVKNKPSAFHGTPLLSYLVDRRIDTVIVTGGATSNCVRATVVDAMSYNFRAVVPHDAVFDRFDISHRIALFDIQRQYGDVVAAVDVIERFDTVAEQHRTGA
jgi:nicotinamidase-related amidase